MAPKKSIADLVAEGRLEVVQADREEAFELLRHAEGHLSSARAICEADPAGAYQLLYDAARKAVAAEMLAGGRRAKPDRPGAHAAVVLYAEEALAGDADAEALEHFDQMRRSRNRVEYGGATFGRAQVENDLGFAVEIVRAVRERLERHGTA